MPPCACSLQNKNQFEKYLQQQEFACLRSAGGEPLIDVDDVEDLVSRHFRRWTGNTPCGFQFQFHATMPVLNVLVSAQDEGAEYIGVPRLTTMVKRIVTLEHHGRHLSDRRENEFGLALAQTAAAEEGVKEEQVELVSCDELRVQPESAPEGAHLACGSYRCVRFSVMATATNPPLERHRGPSSASSMATMRRPRRWSWMPSWMFIKAMATCFILDQQRPSATVGSQSP